MFHYKLGDCTITDEDIGCGLQLYILKTKSLLEEVDDRKKIGMHDLWKEFASYKIEVGEEGRRWVCEHDLYDELKESILIYGGWKELERISIYF